MTPEKARATGTDYIVVGRAVTAAADPAGRVSALLGGVHRRDEFIKIYL